MTESVSGVWGETCMVGAFEQMRRFGLIAVVALAALVALVAPPERLRPEGSGALADDDVITGGGPSHSAGSVLSGWRAIGDRTRDPQAGSADGVHDHGPKAARTGSGTLPSTSRASSTKDGPCMLGYTIPPSAPAEPPRDSNVLSYEFVGTGRYEYQFVVRDTETARYMRFSFEVEVDGDGFIDANEKAREIVAECLPDGNVDDYETALALHDWIIDNVSYDHTFRNMGVIGRSRAWRSLARAITPPM